MTGRGMVAGGDSAFSVTCISRESPPILEHFVRYYDRLGAEAIFITYDDAERADIAALRALPIRAEVVLDFRSAEYWRDRLGDGARTLRNKISAAFHDAKARATTPWLFCTDSDEFLIARTPVSDMLAAVPKDVDAIGLSTAEAVWGPGEDIDTPFGSSWFRRPIWNESRWARSRRLIYGRDAHLFSRGLIAHQSGKHFIRTDRRFDEILSHYSARGGISVTKHVDKVIHPSYGNEVAHFDAICFERWREKFTRRISGEVDAGKRDIRQLQTQRISTALAEGDAAARRLFRSLYCLSYLQIFMLSINNTVFRVNVPKGV